MYLHVQSVLLQYQIYYMFITAPITFNLLIVTLLLVQQNALPTVVLFMVVFVIIAVIKCNSRTVQNSLLV